MNKNEFFMKTKELVELELTRKEIKATVASHKVLKNNGIELHGLSIMREGTNIGPNIYLDSYYELFSENTWDMEEVIQHIIYLFENNEGIVFETQEFFDFDIIKHKIVYKLINRDKNVELLKNVPYMNYLDLAIVCYLIVSDNEKGGASILIKNEHLDIWKISKTELLEWAAKNTPTLLNCSINSIANVLMGMYEQKKKTADDESFDLLTETIMECEKDNPCEMYVISNQKNMNGAACILYRDVLKKIAGKMENNQLYILPSSVHECIILPGSNVEDVDYLQNMIQEINASTVLPEDFLSDHIYQYDYSTDLVTIVA